jgi:DivIVA domain-containing protein
MALTPEQVLNKHFQTTQFRKGYDERDVDDFLDEIVAEMRSLIAQRDDYKQQLNDCRAGRGLGMSVSDPPDAAATARGPRGRSEDLVCGQRRFGQGAGAVESGPGRARRVTESIKADARGRVQRCRSRLDGLPRDSNRRGRPSPPRANDPRRRTPRRMLSLLLADSRASCSRAGAVRPGSLTTPRPRTRPLCRSRLGSPRPPGKPRKRRIPGAGSLRSALRGSGGPCRPGRTWPRHVPTSAARRCDASSRIAEARRRLTPSVVPGSLGPPRRPLLGCRTTAAMSIIAAVGRRCREAGLRTRSVCIEHVPRGSRLISDEHVRWSAARHAATPRVAARNWSTPRPATASCSRPARPGSTSWSAVGSVTTTCHDETGLHRPGTPRRAHRHGPAPARRDARRGRHAQGPDADRGA